MSFTTQSFSAYDLLQGPAASLPGSVSPGSGRLAIYEASDTGASYIWNAGAAAWSVAGKPGQLPADLSGGSANAGMVGEFISSEVLRSAPVSISSTVTANVTSINLTAGDWDVDWISVANTSGVIISQEGGISLTSATITAPAPANGYSQSWNGGSGAANTEFPMSGAGRVLLSAPATLYLVIFGNFTGTGGGYGYVGARRRR